MSDEFVRKTEEELRKISLEQTRVDLVVSRARNEVFLEALKRDRKISGNEEDIRLIKGIREREANEVQFKLDLEMVNEMLKDYN